MNKSYAFSDPSYEEFLIHHGIPKMKWHVRRFENYDGTLTPAGKERYSVYWTKGTNLKGKKVDYDDNKSSGGGKPEASRSILDYQKADGSLTAEGKKKYGDILTETEMQKLVRNYNSANGTNYKVGDVSFKKDGKLYSAEGKRVDEGTKLSKTDTIAEQTKPGLFGRQKELSYKEKLQNVRAMSNEDLQRGIERARLEKAYIAELGIQKSRGERFLDDLKTEAATAATQVARQAVKEAGSAFLKNYVIPKLSEKAGIKAEEADRVLNEIQKGVVQAKQAAKQASQQVAQQKTQQQQNNGNKPKPIEQTSNDDLRQRLRDRGMSEETVKKMSRDDLVAAVKGEKTSNGGSVKTQEHTVSGPRPNEYSKTSNSRPVEYWTREQLKNEIRKEEIKSGSEKKSLDTMPTEELVALVKKQQKG